MKKPLRVVILALLFALMLLALTLGLIGYDTMYIIIAVWFVFGVIAFNEFTKEKK